MDRVDHVYSIYIKAAPERVWQAITDGDDTVRYYYDTRVASTWQAGAPLTYTYPDGAHRRRRRGDRHRARALGHDVVPPALAARTSTPKARSA